jgi:hypothetical protein
VRAGVVAAGAAARAAWRAPAQRPLGRGACWAARAADAAAQRRSGVCVCERDEGALRCGVDGEGRTQAKWGLRVRCLSACAGWPGSLSRDSRTRRWSGGAVSCGRARSQTGARRDCASEVRRGCCERARRWCVRPAVVRGVG